MATPDRDHAFGGLLPGKTIMIAYFMIAELTVLILLCFIGPAQQGFHNTRTAALRSAPGINGKSGMSMKGQLFEICGGPGRSIGR